MITVLFQDFNPKSGCWNSMGSVDLKDFDFNTQLTSKYGGFVRVIFTNEDGKEVSKDEALAIKKGGITKITKKNLTKDKIDDSITPSIETKTIGGKHGGSKKAIWYEREQGN